MKPGIDPKVDCVFKAILGAKDHTALLRHFLNAVLSPEAGIRINEVEILNPYNEREFESDKLSVVDIKARDERGRWFQIEIQLLLHPSLTSRMLYTWSTIYHSLLQKGKDFTALRPVVAIWLVNETLFAVPGAWHVPFVPWNREYGLLLSEDFRIDVLQLPEWRMQEQVYGELDRWMYLFTEGEAVDVEHPPVILQTEEMKQAMGVLQHFAENEREYMMYQKRLDSERVESSWKTRNEQLQTAFEQARREQALERQARERAEREQALERQAREQAELERESERQAKERLLLMLKQAGIEPNSPF